MLWPPIEIHSAVPCLAEFYLVNVITIWQALPLGEQIHTYGVKLSNMHIGWFRLFYQLSISSSVCLFLAPAEHSIDGLYLIFSQSSICPSICLFFATTGHSGYDQFTVIFRLVFQLSICMSVCLSVPLPQWSRALYLHRFTDYSFNWQSVLLSVGSSRREV